MPETRLGTPQSGTGLGSKRATGNRVKTKSTPTAKGWWGRVWDSPQLPRTSTGERGQREQWRQMSGRRDVISAGGGGGRGVGQVLAVPSRGLGREKEKVCSTRRQETRPFGKGCYPGGNRESAGLRGQGEGVLLLGPLAGVLPRREGKQKRKNPGGHCTSGGAGAWVKCLERTLWQGRTKPLHGWP